MCYYQINIFVCYISMIKYRLSNYRQESRIGPDSYLYTAPRRFSYSPENSYFLGVHASVEEIFQP